jgi:hypothetical protein
MGDFFSLMAWMEASEASDAAHGAAAEASRAADESQYLSKLEEDRVSTDRQNGLNKMLQDLFYNREPDLFRLTELQTFVGRYPNLIHREAFPQRKWWPPFPTTATVITLVALGVLWLSSGWFCIVPIVIGAMSAFTMYVDIKEWKYYKDNKENIEIERLKKIDDTYIQIMANLQKEFSMLSARGIVAKYTIDTNIHATYNALYKLNPNKAEAALLQLYYVVLNLKDMSADEESRISHQFHERSEIKNLSSQKKLFTVESLKIYSDLQR